MKLLSTRKALVAVVVTVLSLFSLGAFADTRLRDQSKNDVVHDLEIFAKIVDKVKDFYVDDVDTHEIVKTAIDEMLGELDPHSQFLDGLAFEDLMLNTRGEFGGLGVFISYRDNYPTVISAIDDTPGSRAGLRAGDQIVEIEGMDTDGWRVEKAVKYLRGDPGSKVAFKVHRPGLDEPIDYVLSREVINVKSVPFYGKFNDDYGYIKVNNFSKHTAAEMGKAIVEMEGAGLEGLVIDLRTNPGGLLQAATEVTEMFLDRDKLIVYTKGRVPNSNRKYYSTRRGQHKGYPVVIMVNGGSASASEIFAGALQDWDAAVVVGQTSFGKGTVQTVFNLSDTEAVKLTTAKYYTPSGRSIHKDRSPHKDDGTTASTNDSSSGDGETADVKKDRPVFYTSAGRMVYGGGGITPDLEFEPRLYTELEGRLERDGLGFSFAVKYVDDNAVPRDFKVDDEVLHSFYAFLKDREFEYKQEDLTEENVDYIRTMILREIVANKFGRTEMYRELLNVDPEFQSVLKIMRENPTLDAMLKYAEEQKSVKKASAG